MNTQTKSKQRIREYGEVFTNEREVKAMCDLVKDETERIDSRFLEPACGDGNFLAEILTRKLEVVKRKYKKSTLDYEKNAVLAISSVYGVDIMQDNVLACRDRLFKLWDKEYKAVCKKDCNDQTREAVKFILTKNIVCGNALTLNCVDENGNETDEPIVFSEWAFITGFQMQRQDYTFAHLLKMNEEEKQTKKQQSLFDEKEDKAKFLRRYITHYRRVQENE
ncbi:MAG: restriction endonuclease subunit M [Clostridiales bacterium]|nr:restriction endonuclease subunit M [Clostridiales bacterium]